MSTDSEVQFWSTAISSTFSAFCLTSAVVIAWSILKQKSVTTSAENKCEANPVTVTHPEKWVRVGKIEKLIIYPIKSCQGVVVDEAVVTKLGLKFTNYNVKDRDFMVVDDNGKAITLTQFPNMALISVSVGGQDEITVQAPDMEPCTFTFPKGTTEDEKLCRLFQDKGLKALDCGDIVAEWFQIYLGRSDLRLYYHHLEETQRSLEPYMYKVPMCRKSDMGAFQNETSYLVIAQESIAELNRLLEKDSSWKNWRPNILIDNVQEPFAEVNWSYVRIGNENGILKAAVPCKRCPITTIDPEVGIMSSDGEPLKTLREMNRTDYFHDKSVAEVLKNRGIMGLRMGLYPPAGEGAVLKPGHPLYAALL